MRLTWALSAVLVALVGLVGPPAQAAPDVWRPGPEERLHVQFEGRLSVPSWATMVEVDSADTPASTVRTLRQRGLRTACYISAGTLERWRDDAHRFPSAVIGKPMDGWPGERWLDVRRIALLAPIMRDRIERCRAKGFDAIEFDNVDGWANDSGFPIARADSLRYVRWLTRVAHRHGLAVGLKNALGLVRALADHVQWALNEECVHYLECDRYAPMVQRGKPVFVLEYGGSHERMCRVARKAGLFAQQKRLSLDAWSRPCL